MSNENNDKRDRQVAVVMGRTNGSLSDSVERIKARVSGVNDQSSQVANRIISRTKTKDVDTSENILSEVVMLLEDNLPKGTAKSFFEKVLEKIPGAKKIKKGIERTIIENATASDAVDRVFKAVEGQLTHLSEDLNDLEELTTALDESTLECDDLNAEIEKELEEIAKDKTRRMEGITLRNLQREIASIKIVNSQTANNIHMQFNASEALSTKFSEVKPLLRSMISSQLALSSQIAKNKRMQETADGLSTLLNTMITEGNASAQDTLQETIRLAHKPVITEKTMVELAAQHEKSKKDMVKLISEISNNNVKYLEVQKKTSETLRNSDIKQIAMEIVDKEEQKAQKTKPKVEVDSQGE